MEAPDMVWGQKTAIAKYMIAKMGNPAGRYKEIQNATGLLMPSICNVVRKMRDAGEIPMQPVSGATKTDQARLMLFEMGATHWAYTLIEQKTGLTRESIRSLACKMRKQGKLPAVAKARYEYTGKHMKTGDIVGFYSLQDAEDLGFSVSALRSMFNRGSDMYCGYRWERREI